MSTKEEAEERRKAEENRRWIMQMTAKPKIIEAPAHRAGLNPNFPAHAHSKSQVQPKVQSKSKIISSSSDSESDEELLKITTKIESPKIEPVKVSPKDLLLQKLQAEKIVDNDLSPVEIEKEIEIINDLEPDKPLEPKPKKKSKKQKLLEELEDIPKEDDLDQFDDEEDIFQMKTFEYNFNWTWDVQNETCAICRSSLMELSPNVSDSNGNVIIWGECGHSFHNSCMSLWTKNNPRCPLCQQDWVVARIAR